MGVVAGRVLVFSGVTNATRKARLFRADKDGRKNLRSLSPLLTRSESVLARQSRNERSATLLRQVAASELRNGRRDTLEREPQ